MYIKTDLHRFCNKTGKKWLSCLSIVLLLLSMFPAAALGAGDASITIVTNPTPLTEKNINETAPGFTVEISLAGNTWAETIGTTTTTTNFVKINDAFIPTLKGSFGGTATELSKWNLLLDSASFEVNDTYEIIRITIPKPSSAYDILSNQEVTFTPSPSLLQDSADIPLVKSFTITADPQATLSGSLTTSGVTESNIVSGGRQLIIKLVNCKWASDVATDATQRERLFSALQVVTTPPAVPAQKWSQSVYDALISAPDPSSVIKRDDSQTVTITLPKVLDFNIDDAETVTLGGIDGIDMALLTDMNTTPGPLGSNLTNIIAKTFTVNPVVGSTTVSWGTAPALTETSLNDATVKTLKLTLDGNTWANDIGTPAIPPIQVNLTRQTALLNGFTASTDVAAWDKVKTKILGDLTNFKLVSPKVLEITIPTISGYSILTDQIVTVKIPSTVLENNYTPSNQLSFKITADPAVAVSGTLTTGVTEMDIVNGTINNGKINIVATLTNATWVTGVTIVKALREQLIDELLEGVLWPTVSPALPASPDPLVDPKTIDIIKAGATIVLTNASTVTVTLPPVPGFKISAPLTITPEISDDIGSSLVVSATGTYIASTLPSFTISKVSSQSASISGTVTTATESDIVTGGKTLVITLNNNVWAEDVVSTGLTSLLSTITSDTDSDDWTRVKAALSPSNVVRTSNTVLTITLPPMPGGTLPADPGYALTSDQTINVKIPANTLTFSNPIIVAGSFTVKAVTAALTGTALTAPLNETSALAGGKTIVITLKNATWASDVATDMGKLDALKQCFDSDTGTNWSKIASLITPQNITLSGKNVLTIKLPQVTDYTPDQPEVVSFKLDSVAFSLINENLGIGKELTDIDSTITVGQVAPSAVTASLTGSGLTVPEVVNGNTIITVKLSGVSWDESLRTNKSKISSLVGGLKADSDSASWTMVQTALKNADLTTNNPFALNKPTNDTLTIKLPAVPSYDPVKNQTVRLTIPKTVLKSATDNVSATVPIIINVPSYTPQDGNLKSLLSDGSIAKYINEFSLQNIFLVVPTKFITSVVSKQSTIENTTINSLDIYTDVKVDSVKVKVNGTEYKTDKYVPNGSGRKFNIGFATEKAAKGAPSIDAYITVLEGTTELQSETMIKVVASKTYSLVPATDLSGSYSLYKLTNNSTLLKNILKYYVPADIKVETK